MLHFFILQFAPVPLWMNDMCFAVSPLTLDGHHHGKAPPPPCLYY
ncbi:hypothetical protein L195_g026844 [Trifolium pratense]|uniref:Uncharacterized protein n=1 Tax=Trifolium pratense TaxID=57577 RepID=A0A2K3NKD4_TRIPR|nr:hypothetical protein L195_g026844 [Trifolium pratense]